MTLTEKYQNAEITKQKAARLDDLMRKKELVDAYNKGGADVSAQTASMYANSLAGSLARTKTPAITPSEVSSYMADNLPVSDTPPSGVDVSKISYDEAVRRGLVQRPQSAFIGK